MKVLLVLILAMAGSVVSAGEPKPCAAYLQEVSASGAVQRINEVHGLTHLDEMRWEVDARNEGLELILIDYRQPTTTRVRVMPVGSVRPTPLAEAALTDPAAVEALSDEVWVRESTFESANFRYIALLTNRRLLIFRVKR